ncbi:nuclear polyadenylated RNA-binding protein Nab2 [Aspergillus coremiiformis]|uniref:Nuclear polyadenylated RNA-binding protein Nab2 n=1 Tax=Aspergillus coremiiformis TaxID=138285 RepID=A0A5N6ZA71_9EURO|nr:nuclear polyadenylated RNA-binding protein Nab2 [Aspergillus coremiiformis]
MTTMVAVGTPLAEALSNVIQPKLVEMGWSSDGGDDSALTEYVILMLVNGKTQEQIAGELSNDLLGLGEGDTQALDFSRWLFEQVETLNQQINGEDVPPSNAGDSAQVIPSFTDQQATMPQLSMVGHAGDGTMDADMSMGDAGAANDTIPTGPKAMRNNRQGGRGRMLHQINRQLDRGDSALHRVRGQPGSGRVNSHGRDHTKGRFNQHGGGRMPGGRQMGGMGMGPNQMAGGAGNMMNMNPHDQMHLMSLLEEQARMMAQFMPGFVSPAINPAFQQNGPQQGRSLFDRVERQQGRRPHGSFGKRDEKNTDIDMDIQLDQGGEQDESNTDSVCRFNLRCTRKDCPFAHQSPAAPEGTTVDVSDPCPYGAACKNRKCTGRHPSPAVKSAHQAEEMCRFFPHCANPHCHFKHPSMPLCRNGADCSAEGCKFTHVQTPCKFNPCLNPSCPYKHVEGQKGAFPDKVWTADGQEKPHVSERKFVSEEDGTEELIKPGAPEGSSQNNPEIAT